MPILTKPWIKKYSIFPQNFDLSSVFNFVDVVELLYVKPLLGAELYEEISKQVKDGSVSPENSTLLTDGGLLIYAAQAFALHTLPYVFAHLSQVGITKGKSENSESVELGEISYLTSNLRATVDELKKYTFKWLLEHEGSFPLWKPEDSCGCSRQSVCGCEVGFVEPQPLKLVYGLPRKNDELQ